ncbi:glycerophosphodiester phosphodiesterase family protein [Spirillospora sp. NBC_00431]
MLQHRASARPGRTGAVAAALTAAAVAVVTGTGTPSASAEPAPGRPAARVADIADRGASLYAPENTLASIREAAVRRADAVKIDVRLAKDGFVVLRDSGLARTTNVEQVFPDRRPWNVRDFTVAEIKRLDAGSWFAQEFAGERVPTLGEAFKAVNDGRLGAVLEFPAHVAPAAAKPVERLAGELRRQGAATRYGRTSGLRGLVIESADEEFLTGLERLLPWLTTGLVGTPGTDRLPALAKVIDVIDVPYSGFSASYAALIHGHGLKVHTRTLNAAAAMNAAIAGGADGILTARPDMLRAILSGS